MLKTRGETITVIIAVGVIVLMVCKFLINDDNKVLEYDAQFTEPFETDFQRLYECYDKSIQGLDSEAVWSQMVAIIDKCSIVRARLHVLAYENKDETKYHIDPFNLLSPCTIVTMGVGKDVKAETSLKDRFHCRFVGADPMADDNRDLYNKIGEFHGVAVAGQAGVSNASIYKNYVYVTETINHVAFVDFLAKTAMTPFIDQLLLDAEFAEYSIMPFFLEHKMEEHGIEICQVNIEVHQPDRSQKEMYANWIRNILAYYCHNYRHPDHYPQINLKPQNASHPWELALHDQAAITIIFRSLR